MHAVLLSRPQEVIMSRRIAAGACALALLVPAAASAMPPPNDVPASYGGPTMVGDTKSDLHTTQAVTAPTRGAESLDAMTDKQLAAAYGINNKPEAAPAHAVVVSASDDATNGWRIAAVVEAGVLAAFAVGAAVLLTGRQRRLRLGQ
jgi:hypothetical protein